MPEVLTPAMSHCPLQQSLFALHTSPIARQNALNSQRPVDSPVGIRHTPEQHWPPAVQVSPSVAHALPASAVHTFTPAPTQLPSQQSTLTVQVWVSCLHVGLAAHTPPTQASEQQSAACEH